MKAALSRAIVSFWGCVALAIPVGAGAQTMVLSVRGPSSTNLRAGVVIKKGQSLVLKPGDTVVVWDGNGTRTFKGPGKYSDATKSIPTSLKMELRTLVNQEQARNRTGAATRTLDSKGGQAGAAITPVPQPQPDGKLPESLWQIDPALAGDWCVLRDAELELWRAQSQDGLDVTITGENGNPVPTRWRKAEDVLSWPSQVRVADGARYNLQIGGAAPTYIVTHVIEEPAGSALDLARILSDKHCLHQLRFVDHAVQ